MRICTRRGGCCCTPMPQLERCSGDIRASIDNLNRAARNLRFESMRARMHLTDSSASCAADCSLQIPRRQPPVRHSPSAAAPLLCTDFARALCSTVTRFFLADRSRDVCSARSSPRRVAQDHATRRRMQPEQQRPLHSRAAAWACGHQLSGRRSIQRTCQERAA